MDPRQGGVVAVLHAWGSGPAELAVDGDAAFGAILGRARIAAVAVAIRVVSLPRPISVPDPHVRPRPAQPPDLLDAHPTRPQHDRRRAQPIDDCALDPDFAPPTVQDQLDAAMQIVQHVRRGRGAGSGGGVGGWGC